jgi:SAM-dependent methyltransferase
MNDAPSVHTEDILLSLRGPIAVVGNGRPDRPMGRLIDRYPTVIRLNNYQVEHFGELVGTRTSLRATSGWHDIEHYDRHLEISPFAEAAHESGHLAAYRAANAVPVYAARTDVHALLPGIPKPSTGLSLLALASHLGVAVDAFGFDGFRTGHYWAPGERLTPWHTGDELSALLSLPHVTLFGESYPYAKLHDHCFSRHPEYRAGQGLALYRGLGIALRGERILEFGAGTGRLSQHLEHQGNQVTAVEISDVAFRQIPVARKLRGDAISLAFVDDHFDRFVSTNVLEHLTQNDVRIVVREAARLADSVLVSVSTRPGGPLGPNGENPHLTVRPASWWLRLFGEFFEVSATAGLELGQVVIAGPRRRAAAAGSSVAAREAASPAELELPDDYRAREATQTHAVATGRDAAADAAACGLAAELARSIGCDTLLTLGCGPADALAALQPEFAVVGLDTGAPIDACRARHPGAQWLDADLEDAATLPVPEEVLGRSVVVCADLLGRLDDPRPLLACASAALASAPVLVLTAPDRAAAHGDAHRGPPADASQARQWTADELGRLLARAGLQVVSLTRLAAPGATPTTLAIAVNPAHPAIAATRFGAGAGAAPPPQAAAPSSAGGGRPIEPVAYAEAPDPGPAGAPPPVGAPARVVDAIEEVAELERRHPRQPQIALMAANLRFEVGDPAGSLASAARAVSLCDADADAHFAVARAALALGDVERFEPALGRALAIDPQHRDALRLLARLQAEHGAFGEASDLYERLLSLDESDAESLEGAVVGRLRAGQPARAAALLHAHAH